MRFYFKVLKYKTKSLLYARARTKPKMIKLLRYLRKTMFFLVFLRYQKKKLGNKITYKDIKMY